MCVLSHISLLPSVLFTHHDRPLVYLVLMMSLCRFIRELFLSSLLCPFFPQLDQRLTCYMEFHVHGTIGIALVLEHTRFG